MPTIHVIGAGGIGSYLVRELVDLVNNNQIISENSQIYDIHVYDDDEVEQKNILYQNYEEENIFEPKVDSLVKKYPTVTGIENKVTDLDSIVHSNDDIIVSCVDNTSFRSHLFEWQESNPNFWIDLRSHGRIVVRLSKSSSNTKDYLMSTLPKEETHEDGSCQRAIDIENNLIQVGNRIIAMIGAQTIINHVRGVSQDSRFTRQF
jgi:hypothetical protein